MTVRTLKWRRGLLPVKLRNNTCLCITVGLSLNFPLCIMGLARPTAWEALRCSQCPPHSAAIHLPFLPEALLPHKEGHTQQEHRGRCEQREVARSM